MDLMIDHNAGWVRFSLNRPAQKHALNTALLATLAAMLADCAGDPACRAVVLTRAEGNFAAGADIGEIEGKNSTEGAADPRKAHCGPFPVLFRSSESDALLKGDRIWQGNTARRSRPVCRAARSASSTPGQPGGGRLMCRRRLPGFPRRGNGPPNHSLSRPLSGPGLNPVGMAFAQISVAP